MKKSRNPKKRAKKPAASENTKTATMEMKNKQIAALEDKAARLEVKCSELLERNKRQQEELKVSSSRQTKFLVTISEHNEKLKSLEEEIIEKSLDLEEEARKAELEREIMLKEKGSEIRNLQEQIKSFEKDKASLHKFRAEKDNIEKRCNELAKSNEKLRKNIVELEMKKENLTTQLGEVKEELNENEDEMNPKHSGKNWNKGNKINELMMQNEQLQNEVKFQSKAVAELVARNDKLNAKLAEYEAAMGVKNEAESMLSKRKAELTDLKSLINALKENNKLEMKRLREENKSSIASIQDDLEKNKREVDILHNSLSMHVSRSNNYEARERCYAENELLAKEYLQNIASRLAELAKLPEPAFEDIEIVTAMGDGKLVIWDEIHFMNRATDLLMKQAGKQDTEITIAGIMKFALPTSFEDRKKRSLDA